MWSSGGAAAVANANASNKAKLSTHGSQAQPKRRQSILPSRHEQKRLMQMEQEEKRRKSTVQLQSVLDKLNDKGALRDEEVTDGDTDEEAPLNGKCEGGPFGYGAASTTDDTDGNGIHNPISGLFNQLLSIMNGARSATSDGQQRQLKHHSSSSLSIEEETKSYRDRNQAFLKKTEEERMRILQRNRRDEMSSVIIPMVKEQISSLDAIPSCSDMGILEEDEEESSSDEDSEAGFYSESQFSEGKVTKGGDWEFEYGMESPTLSSNPVHSAQQKRKSVSRHDRIMEQERLEQEEEEYRQRQLSLKSKRSESEKLGMMFRILAVAIAVVILVGALALFLFAQGS